MTIRNYHPTDERSWLRCRVLGFLDTAYFDDVATHKPPRDLELVAAFDGQIVGLLDASLNGPEATIETIVVHPGHRRRGIARTLLHEACTRLAARGALQVDAWTRDDEGTLTWYAEHGFTETMRYLHVYASTPQEAAAAYATSPQSTPATGYTSTALPPDTGPAFTASSPPSPDTGSRAGCSPPLPPDAGSAAGSSPPSARPADLSPEPVGGLLAHPELMPQRGFFHAWIEHEDTLRAQFQRVHVCRRFVRRLG